MRSHPKKAQALNTQTSPKLSKYREEREENKKKIPSSPCFPLLFSSFGHFDRIPTAPPLWFLFFLNSSGANRKMPLVLFQLSEFRIDSDTFSKTTPSTTGSYGCWSDTTIPNWFNAKRLAARLYPLNSTLPRVRESRVCYSELIGHFRSRVTKEARDWGHPDGWEPTKHVREKQEEKRNRVFHVLCTFPAEEWERAELLSFRVAAHKSSLSWNSSSQL